MGVLDLRNKYGLPSANTSRQVVNHAIRASVVGGAEILDLLTLVIQMRDRGACPQVVVEKMLAIRGRMADFVLNESGQKETPPVKAASVSIPENRIVQDASIHAPQAKPVEAKAELSLDLLKPSSQGSARANQSWTPPADLVAQMEHLPIAELARIAGVPEQLIRDAMRRLEIEPVSASVGTHRWTPEMDRLLGTRDDDDLGKRWGRSAEAVRRRRVKLGIKSTRPKTDWADPNVVALLQSEPDNAAIAKQLGCSANAVKIARSRAKGQGPREANDFS